VPRSSMRWETGVSSSREVWPKVKVVEAPCIVFIVSFPQEYTIFITSSRCVNKQRIIIASSNFFRKHPSIPSHMWSSIYR
jgi:hypothetical protein